MGLLRRKLRGSGPQLAQPWSPFPRELSRVAVSQSPLGHHGDLSSSDTPDGFPYPLLGLYLRSKADRSPNLLCASRLKPAPVQNLVAPKPPHPKNPRKSPKRANSAGQDLAKCSREKKKALNTFKVFFVLLLRAKISSQALTESSRDKREETTPGSAIEAPMALRKLEHVQSEVRKRAAFWLPAQGRS